MPLSACRTRALTISVARPGQKKLAAVWLAAPGHGIVQLEDVTLERAILGTELPVYSDGRRIGARTVYIFGPHLTADRRDENGAAEIDSRIRPLAQHLLVERVVLSPHPPSATPQ